MLGVFPIPRSLLPSTMLVRRPDPDAKREGRYLEPEEIAGVRFELALSQHRTAYQLSDTTEGLVFVDAASSEGAFAVPVDSLVQVDGGDWMQVVACHEFSAFLGTTHHWELEVR